MIRMRSIIDDHTIDKHGDSPVIDDFWTEQIYSTALSHSRVPKLEFLARLNLP